MIGVWCQDQRLKRAIVENLILTGHEVSCFIDWREFDRSVPLVECSVIAVTPPVEASVVMLLRRIVANSEREGTGSWPVVVVEDAADLASARMLRLIPQTTISLSQVDAALLDAIPQDVARATLRYLERQLRRTAIDAVLRSALLVAIREDEFAHTVRALARRTHVGASTLHHHWRAHELGRLNRLTLKEFLDVVLLLKLRARKTPRLTWSEVALEYATTTEHVEALYRNRMGPWRERDRGGWLTLAARVRLWEWAIPPS